MRTSPDRLPETIVLEGRQEALCLWLPGRATGAAPNRHAEFEIHFIKRGRGSYFIGRRSYPFEANHLVVIRSGLVHKCVSRAPVLEKGTLCLARSLLEGSRPLARALAACRPVLALGEREAALVEVLFRTLSAEIERREACWAEMVRAGVEMLVPVIGRAAAGKPGAAGPRPLTLEMLAWLDRHHAADITPGDLAAALHRSPSRLAHVFREDTSLTIRDYLYRKRVAEAKVLLASEPRLRAREVAARTGFRDYEHFARNFRKITGLTPTAYRAGCPEPATAGKPAGSGRPAGPGRAPLQAQGRTK